MKKYIAIFSIAMLLFTACATDTTKTNVKVTTNSNASANTNLNAANTIVITNNANSAASNAAADNAKPDMHNAQNALDWEGVYHGTLPCADCAGIKTTIELKKDKTFTRKDEYLGEKGETFNESGTFSWEKDGTVITLKSKDETAKFMVAENEIIMLDADDKVNKGELADKYILKKK